MFRHNKPIEPERTVVAAPRQVARLKATLEDGMQTFLPLTSTPVTMTIGRDPSCGWYLQDLSVSRIHASIRWSGVALSIEDHGSSGGTFVANRQVGTTPCLVRPGDSVRVGDAIFVLELTSGIASGDIEQTRMVPNPHSPMSGAVTPAPSRNQKPVELLPLGTSADDERTAFSAVAAPHAEPHHSRSSARDDEERTAFSKIATPARGMKAHAQLPSVAD
ncbi:MAG TPA: FHA domain-containing protein, partial [Polyangia bacterium]|nr:FHA domain-containing protein [Polyangia bacterium]